jgi:hypothetical protein
MCVKRRYRDEIAAKMALAKIGRTDSPDRAKIPRRAYFCASCGGWHLTYMARF